MSKESEEWHQLFCRVFAAVKQKFKESFPLQLTDESELPPDVATLWGSIEALPFAVKVVNLKIDPAMYDSVRNPTCQLIRFDFSRYGDDSVEYVGEVNVADTSSLEKVLVSEFDVSPQNAESTAREISSEFRTAAFWDDEKPQFYYEVTSYDIQGNLEEFADRLSLLFRMSLLPESAFEKFRTPKIHFNALYSLQPDRISSIAENIDMARNRGYPRVSFEDLQRSVAGIQLIPQVPGDVHRVFRSAKDLHILGYFRYSFFTISQHYAFLALESAIRHRYIQSLGGKAILRNKRNQSFEMLHPTYRGIEDYCYRNRKSGWRTSELVVNGERFPHTMPKLLNWLVNRKLITVWERPSYSAGVHLRNSLSHLEKTSIFTPSSTILSRVAYQINKLFHEATLTCSRGMKET